jgi:hypothetical protein
LATINLHLDYDCVTTLNKKEKKEDDTPNVSAIATPIGGGGGEDGRKVEVSPVKFPLEAVEREGGCLFICVSWCGVDGLTG